MDKWKGFINDLSLKDAKDLLISLAKEVFSLLDAEEKKEFIQKMVGQTGHDKIGSMVQL